MTSSTEISGSKIGRARRKLSQLWQAPIFLVGLFAFLGVAASAPWRQTPQAQEFHGLLAKLRAGVGKEDADADQLVVQAETALSRLSQFHSYAGELHFLAGSAYYRQGRQKPAQARDIWPRAVDHLEQAHTLGVADADRAPLQYRLGYSLFQMDKDVPRALELLTLSVEKSEQPLQGYQMLAEANLKLPKPNLEAALRANQRVLDLTSPREIDAIAGVRLQQAEILLRKEQRGEAVKALELIDARAPQAIRIKARLLQTQCLEEDGHWEKAIVAWMELLQEAPRVEGGKARILYQLGLACLRVEPRDTAEAIRAWSEAAKLGGMESQAAGLRLGELRLSLGDKETAGALADWQQALKNVDTPADYRNPHVELKKLRGWFDQTIRRFQDGSDPQKMQEFARLYKKIAPEGSVETDLARAAEALAELLVQQRKPAGEVNGQYRRAGDAYEDAARVRPEKERPGLLWRAGQCYLNAKEPALALKTFNEHAKIEKNELRLAESWCIIGDLYWGSEKKDAAREAYYKCLEYGKGRFACKARYFLAVEKIEKRGYSEAYIILKENLDATGDVDRVWQDKSLYKLGWLAMQMKKYEEARVYLSEYVRSNSGNASAQPARERLGECYRMLADKEDAKLKELAKQLARETNPQRRMQIEDAEREIRKQRMELLRQARDSYEHLRDELKDRAREGPPLNETEAILLRRAQFGIGECYLDGNEFFDAKEAFRVLQIGNRKTLEGLYASQRICNMPDVIPNPKEAEIIRKDARESLQMLLEDLKAMPAEHPVFRVPGVPSRAAWLQFAGDMQQKLQASTKNP